MEKRKLKSLDLTKLKSGKIVSSQDALKDVIPMNWSKEVLAGEKRIKIIYNR